jgi:hypothetical protein
MRNWESPFFSPRMVRCRVEVFSSEKPFAYLIFPYSKKHNIHVERLLKLVVIPALEETLQIYDLPPSPTLMKGLGKYGDQLGSQ